MDPLFQAMMQRQMQQGQPQEANGLWTKASPAMTQPQGQPPMSGGAQSMPPMMPGQGQQTQGQGSGPPQAGSTTNTHTQTQRAANANALGSAYENNWEPNPVVMRMMMGK